MKAIILISSIFYILGLKLSHKFDLVKKTDPVNKTITNNIETKQPGKNAYFSDEVKLKNETDSIKKVDSNEPLSVTKDNF